MSNNEMAPQEITAWLRKEADDVQSVIEIFDREEPNSTNATLADFRKYAITADLIESLTAELAAQAEVSRGMREAISMAAWLLSSFIPLSIHAESYPKIMADLQKQLALTPTEAEQRAASNAALRQVVEDYLIVNWDAFPKFDGAKGAFVEWMRIVSQAVERRKHEMLDPLISKQAEKAELLDWWLENPRYTFSMGEESIDPWQLVREYGSWNDRQWETVGVGHDQLQLLRDARAAKAEAGKGAGDAK